MKRITIWIASVYCAGIALGQAGNSKRALTPPEQSAVIEKVRELALRYTKQLPNYICTQRTLQVVRQGIDVIEEQISFVDNRETRRVVSRNRHPVAADSPEQQLGTPSRGEFGTLLAVIFDPRTAANLEWKRQARWDHRPVHVLAYRVPQSEGYTLIDSKGTIQVPYQGSVYADAETLSVVRIEMQVPAADIPKGSEYLKVALTLDYKPEQVAGRQFLLPASYALVYQMKSGKATYLASYTDYRKFTADATIQFEDEKKP